MLKGRLILLLSIFSLNILFSYSAYAISFKIGYTGILNEAPLFIAREKKFYLDEGIGLELIKIESDKIVSALNSRQVDLVLINPYLTQLGDIRLFGAISSAKVEVVVKRESSIIVSADLAGKRIGIETLGNNDMIAFSLELIRSELDPLKDVHWVEIKKNKFHKALASGKIDCYVTSDAELEAAIDPNIYKKLFNLGYDGPYRFFYVYFLGAKQAFIDANFNQLIRLLKILKKAASWIYANRDQAFAVLKNSSYYSINFDNRLLDSYAWVPATEKEKNRFVNFVCEQIKHGVLPASFNWQSYIEEHFIKIPPANLVEDELTDYRIAEDCCSFPEDATQ